MGWSKEKVLLLLHPPGACSAFTRSGSQYPPLGLNHLKAVVGNTHNVDVLEADGKGWTPEDTANVIWDEAPQAIGMTVTYGTKKLTSTWTTLVRIYHRAINLL